MSSDDWHALEHAFQHAVTLAPAARAEYLAEWERRDAALADRLRALLEADALDDASVCGPVEASISRLAREIDDPWLGRRIGAWTLVGRIASGGMGVVFMAERADDEYRKRAALKVMSGLLLAPDAVARFRAERQILATLDHPYVARLLDGGSTEEGLPWLAMEYVDGLPIDDWCEARRLDVDARLGIFLRVCEAVDYAHRNLVVHRDLKPSNILVDEAGTPRLLDFGIAKLLEGPQPPAAGDATRLGARALTPEYASPEQIRGETVGLSTDVYALGVLLYWLLTGRSPYGSRTSSHAELESAIVDLPVPKPSLTVEAGRGTVPPGSAPAEGARLRKRLAGDLDNIVLKALQKQPAKRYPSAAAFADDVLRHLRHEPVHAHGDDPAYRARLFVRRHRTGVATVAAVVCAVVALATYHGWRLAAERDRAELAAAESREVAGFLAELLANASPFDTRGEPLTMTQLLDRGRERFADLDGSPQLRAELAVVMGRAYTGLDALDRALPLLEEAVRLREGDPAADPLARAAAWKELGETQRLADDLGASEESLRRALALRESALGRQSSDVAEILGRLGVLLFDARRPEEALAALEEARGIKEGLGENDSMTVDILGNIGISLDTLGRLEEAERVLRETVVRSRSVDGERNPNTLIRQNNHGLVLMRLARYEDALATFQSTLATAREVFPYPSSTVAIFAGAAAGALRNLGRFAEALALYEEARDIVAASLGEKSAANAGLLRGLATLMIDMQRFADAERTLRRAQAVAEMVDGGTGSNSNVIRYLLGQALVGLGRFEEAEQLLRRAESAGTTLNANTARSVRTVLAEALDGQSRHAEAREIFEAVVAEQAATTGEESPAMVGRLVAAAAHHRRYGELERALALAERAHVIAAANLPAGNWRAALATVEYADALAAAGRDAEAAPLYRRARAELLATLGPDDPRVRRLAAATPLR
jgi:eukaryotic-like serine/threonine-protein kinase